MASRRSLAMLFTLHSWAGIITGLLMFIVCFSGAVVVFKHEIDLWANPSLRALERPAVAAPLDRVLAEIGAAYPGSSVESIWLPDAVSPAYYAFLRSPGQGEDVRTKIALHGDSGTLIGPVDSQLGQFIRMLHVFLFFGPRWIVGFLGVAMLVLIGTGIVIHRKILAELFTQRWGRSLRVVMSDLHKAAGVWGLLFHIVIAFTGAWLGLAPVFERAWQFAAQPPRPAMAVRAATKASAAMLPLEVLRQRAAELVPGFEMRSVALRNWGTAGATVSFAGGLRGHLASTANVQFDASTGRPRKVHDPRTAGFWSLVNGLMEPLHFGDFGGLTLKWLYFLLGLTPAFLSLSGTVIWLDSRRQRAPVASLSPAGHA